MLRVLFLKLSLLPTPMVKTLPGGVKGMWTAPNLYLLCGSMGDSRLFPLCMQSCMVLLSLFHLSQSGHPTVADRQRGTRGGKVPASVGHFTLLQWCVTVW